MDTIFLKAYAKINIGLEVLFKRPDGYHEINTIFSRIPIFDEILISKNNELIVECTPSLEIPQEKNIVYKAVRKFQNLFGIEENLIIKIKKQIPHGAGLGGGSSDAGTVLKELHNIWKIKITDTDLFNIAASLGSDVPYFLSEGSALGVGRGEILEYFDYSVPYIILLVFPGIVISTKWAYSELNMTNQKKHASDLIKLIEDTKANKSVFKDAFVNDFETVAFREYPELKEIKSTLYDTGAVYSQLSGSGSAMFGFFENEDEVQNAVSHLKKYEVKICSPII